MPSFGMTLSQVAGGNHFDVGCILGSDSGTDRGSIRLFGPHCFILWLKRCGVIAKMTGIHITSHLERVEDTGHFPLVDI